MKRIAFTWRMTLRKILTALIGAAAFLFGSCPWIDEPMAEYGMPYPEYGMPPTPTPYHVISGTVIGDNKPVPGIFVSAFDKEVSGSTYDVYTFTNDYGAYYLYLQGSGCYTVCFTDVDGPRNGIYKSHEADWCAVEDHSHSGDGLLHVALQPQD